MRVLHVIESLPLGGGAERNLVAVLPAMRGIDHHVVHLRSADGYAPQIRAAGATVERVPWDGPGGWPRALRRLRELARVADVVHTQVQLSDLVGRLAALGATPTVTSIQTTPYDAAVMRQYSRPGQLKTAFFWGSDIALSAAASRLVAVSEHAREALVARVRVAREKTRVIYNAIDVGAVTAPSAPEREAIRGELGLKAGDLALVSVGKLVPAKGQELLIEAMPTLLGRVPGATLLLAGDGTQRGDLERRAAALGLGDRVKFLGLRGDLMRLLGGCDAFALASTSEGLPLSVVEAMAARLPCVLSAIPPHREMQGRVGEQDEAAGRAMVVGEASPGGWAEVLGEVLGDARLRAAMGEAGRRAAERHFDVRVTGPALAAVLGEAAREKNLFFPGSRIG